MADPATATKVSLRDVVRSCCDGLFDAAGQRERVSAALRAMPGLHAAVWDAGIDNIVAGFRFDFRAAVKANRCPRGIEAIRAANNAAGVSLLRWFRFDDGRCLGELLREEVEPYALQQEAEADGHKAVARWLRAVAALVPPRGKVRNHVTDEQARALAQQEGMDNG